MTKINVQQYTLKELNTFRENLSQEFINADKGDKTNLAYVRHSINLHKDNVAKKNQVLVIGGSNLVSSLVEPSNNGISILSKIKEPLPPLETKEILLSIIGKHCHAETDSLGVNFAYPLTPVYQNGKLDGILQRGNKGHSLTGLIDQIVGDEIEKYMESQYGKKINVSVANDVICLVLAGLNKGNAESLAGGIIGTGINFGFFLDETVVVNLESGNFNNFSPTDTGIAVDTESDNPGRQLFEKEISGAYLFKHFNIYAQKYGFNTSEVQSTEELNKIASGSNVEATVAQELFKRSASLAAVHLAAIYDFKQSENLTVLIEGSLFWKGWGYEESVYSYLNKMGIEKNAFSITHIDDSYIHGAARLIL